MLILHKNILVIRRKSIWHVPAFTTSEILDLDCPPQQQIFQQILLRFSIKTPNQPSLTYALIFTVKYEDAFYLESCRDQFERLGYSLKSVQLGGQGSQSNLRSWYVMMSK
jgi:hypothetical protein